LWFVFSVAALCPSLASAQTAGSLFCRRCDEEYAAARDRARAQEQVEREQAEARRRVEETLRGINERDQLANDFARKIGEIFSHPRDNDDVDVDLDRGDYRRLDAPALSSSAQSPVQWSDASRNAGTSAVASTGQVTDYTQQMSDDVWWVYVQNNGRDPIRILDGRVFNCVEAGLGCGATARGFLIRPHESARIASVMRSVCLGSACAQRPPTTFEYTYNYEVVQTAR
jgi:hypothetical protein